LDKNASATLNNGNLVQDASSSAWRAVRSTMFVSSGKWYWEGTLDGSGSDIGMIGVSNQSASLSAPPDANAWGYNGSNGNKFHNGVSSAYGATYGNGNTVGIALDMDAGTITFYKNGSTQGEAFSGLSGSLTPTFFQYAGNTWTANFGQRPFAHTAPSGFKALVTTNLPEPTVVQGDEHFSATTYTGTGSSGLVVTTGLASGLVWIKDRQNANHHVLFDQVRGINKTLASNLTNSEYTVTSGSGLLSFDSTGFTLGTETSGAGSTNASSRPYISWNWKANGAGSLNEAGTIDSTVSVSAISGFSIVTYTGNGLNAPATIGHGLGVAPQMMILKFRDAGSAWSVYHASVGNTRRLTLNTTDAQSATDITLWNNTSPTLTVFSVGSNFNQADVFNYVAYCFAEVEGFSKFGGYTGNGNSGASGTFVYLGFRPKFFLIKCSAGGVEAWWIYDSTRDSINYLDSMLSPNQSAAETSSSAYEIDFLSNGIKIRVPYGYINGLSQSYIYAAFAENPFKYSLAR
jgi:hypothetical protein